jgi:branched-chain amino acid transport system permease protein
MMLPESSSYTVTRSTRSSQIGLSLAGITVIALLFVPLWASTDTMRLAIDIFLYIALAAMWNFLAGYAGLMSIGQQAYVGLGGYLFFALTANAGLSPWLSLVLVGLAVAVLSVPVAGLVFRLRGAYFAIGSWVVAEVFRIGANLVTPLGGASGMSLPTAVAKAVGEDPQSRYAAVYWTSIALLLLVLVLIAWVLRSRWGLALTAIRDNELAARSSGIDVDRSKLVVYVVTAFGTAMVGAMIFMQKLRISPDAAFNINDWTALVIFMVVIGGLGSFEGPIIGTLIYFALRETLAELGTYYLMILGAVAIVTMLWAPQGLWGLARKRWHLQLQLLPLRLRVLPRQ